MLSLTKKHFPMKISDFVLALITIIIIITIHLLTPLQYR